jgi:hypothetical protein
VAVVLLVSGSAAAQVLSPGTLADGAIAQGAPDCGDGVVLDDGTLESGYGWVPSVIDGRYVQEFQVEDFRSRKIEEVCVCWTRTRPDEDVDFLVQLYRDRGGRPARHPEVSVAATATMVPTFPDGAFYSIDVSRVDMRAVTNTFYIGVQWNASSDEFFFVCVDRSEATPIVDGWYIDDRAQEWTSVLDTPDPTFNDHHAMMIRARAAEGLYPLVPTLGAWGILVLVLVIASIGALVLRRTEG